MDKRTVLAVVLSLAVLFAYQIFFAKPHIPPTAVPAQQQKQAPDQIAKKQPEAIAVEAVAKPVAQKITAQKENPPRDVKVETENYIAVFSTRGAALKSFQLKNYRKECTQCVQDIWPKIKNAVTGNKKPVQGKSGDLIELVSVQENTPYPLALTFPESMNDIIAQSVYDTKASRLDMRKNMNEQQLVFSRTFDHIKVEKIYTFNPDNFSIVLDVKVSNLTNEPLTQVACLNWYEYVDPIESTDRYSNIGPVQLDHEPVLVNVSTK